MPLPRRVRWFALIAGVAAIQVFGSFGMSREHPERASIDAVAVVLLLVGPLSLAVSRRWPLVPAVVATAAAGTFIGLGYPYGPVFLSMAVAFFLAVQRAPRVAVIPLAAVSVTAVIVVAATEPRAEDVGWIRAIPAIAWSIAILAVAEFVRMRRERIQERRHTLQVERERLLADQRVALAQELHDVLGHNISLINVQASVALHLIDEEPERAADALANIKRASAEALDELRAALDLLRSGESPHAPAPRLVDLADLVTGVGAGGLTVDLRIDGDPARVPAAVELAAYRIVQEALTNATRHSNARRVDIDMTVTPDAVDVEVVDDGTGATAIDVGGNGRGITGMHERAAALGGAFEAGPTPTGGFRVTAHLPFSFSPSSRPSSAASRSSR